MSMPPHTTQLLGIYLLAYIMACTVLDLWGFDYIGMTICLVMSVVNKITYPRVLLSFSVCPRPSTSIKTTNRMEELGFITTTWKYPSDHKLGIKATRLLFIFTCAYATIVVTNTEFRPMLGVCDIRLVIDLIMYRL